MDQKQYRVTEVAKILHRFIKADLPEDLSLAMIGRQFPGISRGQLLDALVVCKDEAVLDRERSEEMLASMRETMAGYTALLALVSIWRSQSDEQRRAISRTSSELAGALNDLKIDLIEAHTQAGWGLLANLMSRKPH